MFRDYRIMGFRLLGTLMQRPNTFLNCSSVIVRSKLEPGAGYVKIKLHSWLVILTPILLLIQCKWPIFIDNDK